MGWMKDVLDAMREAAVLSTKVDGLAKGTGDLAREVRDLDRRLARIEGALFSQGLSDAGRETARRLPGPDGKD